MNLKTRYSILIACVISVVLAGFSALVFTNVEDELTEVAHQILSENLDHERWHIESKINRRDCSAGRLHRHDIYYRIFKDGKLIDDNTPAHDPDGTISEDSEITTKEGRYRLTGTFSLHGLRVHLAALARVLSLGCLIAFVLIIPLSFLLTRSLLRPFGRLAKQTGELDARSLDFRFPSPKRKDEYGTLAIHFNTLLSRLERSFNQTRKFATNASHELRTPVSVIRGEAELLLRKPREISQYREGLATIVEQTDGLQRLIQRLLFFSDLERIEQTPENSPIDVPRSVAGAVNALRTMHDAQNKNIEIRACSGLMFSGHQELFLSVVNNLVENAIKYSKTKIVVHVEERDRGIWVEVEDDGPGIPTAEREIDGDGTRLRSRSKKGHGLGLSIVRACVQAARGNLELGESGLGGLRVSVFFPQPLPSHPK